MPKSRSPTDTALDAEQAWMDAGLSELAVRSLVDRLQCDSADLERQWTGRLVELPVFQVRLRSRDQVTAWTGTCLPRLLTIVATGSAATLRRQADNICTASTESRFDVGEVVAGLQEFQEIALGRALAGLDPEDSLAARAGTHLKSRLCLAIVRCSRLYAERMRRAAEEAHERTERLYERSREELLLCRARHQIFTAMLQKVGLSKILELVGGETLKLMDARGVSVALLGDDGELQVALSLGECPAWARVGLDDFASAGVLPVEPILVDDLVAEQLDGRGADSQSVIVPMRTHGKPIGALQIVASKARFDRSDLRLAKLIAEQLGLAIEHAELHSRQERTLLLEERHRLARDLHDSVTQSLYGGSTLAEAAARLLDAGRVDEASERLRELKDVVLGALREMRHLIFELTPPDIVRSGLVAALKTRLEAVEMRSGVATRLRVDREADLPVALAAELYALAQEACHNAVRHAGAATIEIRLGGSDDRVQLTISDDGSGFDLAAGRASGGLGLRGMEARVSRLDGHLAIESEPGHGTRVTVDVPLRDGAGDPKERT